jgi:hypothetical protein
MGGVINILNVSAGGGGGGESYWSQNSTGISTISNVGIGTTTATSRLTVDGDGYFTGIITANQFTTQTGGTPTIDSPNNLNINANTVAISTNLTVGSDSSISNNLSVSGIATIGLLDVGVGGTILSSTSDGKVGIGTTNATHILTVGSVGASGTSLFVHGDARIVGVLSVGQGTITIDGNTNTISATNIVVSNSLTAEGGVGYATEGYVDNLVAISTFSGDYNDLINQPNIPSIVGLASEGYVDNLVAISTFSGDYGDLSNTPIIPSDTSNLTNNAGFVTSSIVVGYATEGYVDNLVAISTFSGDYNDLNNQPNYIDFSGVSTSVSGGIASVTQLNVSGVTTTTTLQVGAATTQSVLITSSGNIGLSSTNPSASLDLSQKTDGIALPQGTTAQRPTGNNPYIRYNTTNSALEFYNGTDWVEIISDYFPTGSVILG